MPTYNEAQKRAIEFKNGTMLLLAGPGSGKTFVITHRIKALIDSGIDPSKILVITFTKAAALQMQDRFEKLCDSEIFPVTFGTFHAIFFQILRTDHNYRNLQPVTDKEKYNMLKQSVGSLMLNEQLKSYEDMLMMLSLIGACKNNGNDPANFQQEMLEQNDFVRLFQSYNDLLKAFGKLDFDDMINLCLEYLKKEPEKLRKWQERFTYILIDEFQDISGNQYELIKMLARPQNNIFAVGDDDQSIYRFRGAKVELMKALLEDIPGAEKDYLSVNYRSSGLIVKSAGIVIGDNKDRFSKNISADRENGEFVSVIKTINNLTQKKEVEKIIQKNISEGISPSEITILVRTNRQGRDWADFLSSCSIRVNNKSCEQIFSSEEIKDIMAYLAAGDGDRSRETFTRIVNRPVRFIKREAMKSSQVSKRELLIYYQSDAGMKRNIETMFANLDRLKFQRPYLAVKYIRNVIGYDKYVKDNQTAEKYNYYKDEAERFEEFVKGLDSFRQVCERLKEIRELTAETYKEDGKKGINIMTYHGSKGLEFDTVILPDVNEGVIPPRNAKNNEAVEEERRLFYVAMTRAKNRLYILYRLDEGKKMSRFIQKLK